MNVNTELSAINRRYHRRMNAAAVMEEATAEMARRHQNIAHTERVMFEETGSDVWQRRAAKSARRARRYLFALIGDGTPEEIPEHWRT